MQRVGVGVDPIHDARRAYGSRDLEPPERIDENRSRQIDPLAKMSIPRLQLEIAANDARLLVPQNDVGSELPDE